MITLIKQIFSAEKEKRATEQSQRDLRMKLLTQIEGIDENLNLVKEDIKRMMEEMTSKMNNVENKNVEHIGELKIVIQGIENKLIEKIDNNFKQLHEKQETEMFKMKSRLYELEVNTIENMKNCSNQINKVTKINLDSIEELKFATKSQETRLTEKIDKNLKQLQEIQEEEMFEMKTRLLESEVNITENMNHCACQIYKVSKRNLESIADLKFASQSQEVRLVDKIDDDIKQLMAIQDIVFSKMEASLLQQVSDVSVFKNDAAVLIEKVTEVSDKIMDFEKNKRNNLIFCGIPNDGHESPSSLDNKVRKDKRKLFHVLLQVAEILRNQLQIQKAVTLKRVGRILTGPEVGGSRPVIVTFPSFNEREIVWKRAGLLSGTSLSITEDVHKWEKSHYMLILLVLQTCKGFKDGVKTVPQRGQG